MTQKEKNAALREAAFDGDIERVVELLADGADIDDRLSDGRTPLMRAAYGGHIDVVRLLLEEGADRLLRDKWGDTAADDALRQGYGNVAALLKERPAKIKSPDQVVFSRRVHDRTLQEIFDFAARERVTLIRKSEHGAVEAVIRDPFGMLTDREGLHRAFNEYRQRGGTLGEEEVFAPGMVLNKNGPGLR